MAVAEHGYNPVRQSRQDEPFEVEFIKTLHYIQHVTMDRFDPIRDLVAYIFY